MQKDGEEAGTAGKISNLGMGGHKTSWECQSAGRFDHARNRSGREGRGNEDLRCLPFKDSQETSPGKVEYSNNQRNFRESHGGGKLSQLPPLLHSSTGKATGLQAIWNRARVRSSSGISSHIMELAIQQGKKDVGTLCNFFY
jgi:hypothetical protein